MNDRQPNFEEPRMITDDEIEGRVVENPNIQALSQLNAAEINQQIMTARAYPRSITPFRRSMREMVTYDQATALSCLYALKRSGKVIEGPSIRFAEAAIQAWGNARAGARIVDIGDEFITAQGFFYDLEKNMAIAFEVMRRITDRDGNRYGDDMIGVTGNAACSIAIRNAILRGIPKTAWNESYQEARHVSIGKGESISVKREEMLKAFAPLGVDKDQIFALLGVKGLDDVSVDHMILMGGILNSIKEGEVTVEAAFDPKNNLAPGQVAPPRPRQSDFSRNVDKKTGEKKTDPDKKPEPEKKDPPKTETGSTSPAAGDATVQSQTGTASSKTADPVDEAHGAADAVREEMDAWYDDMKAALAACTRVQKKPGDSEPQVMELRDFAAQQLDGERLEEWQGLCAAKVKEILHSNKKPK